MIMSALAKQIINNQHAIGPAVEEPIVEEPIVEEPDEEEPDEEPDGKILFTYDINEGIDPAVIEKLGYPSMEEIMKKPLEEIEAVLIKVAEYKARIGSKVSREQRINGQEAADAIRKENNIVSVSRERLFAKQKELERNKSSFFSDVSVDGAWGKGIKKKTSAASCIQNSKQ